MSNAQVVATYAGAASVRADNGTLHHIPVSNRSLFAGDLVTVSPEYDTITAVLPRHTSFARRIRPDTYKTIAVNCTQLAVVVAEKPTYTFGLIDTLIALAHACAIKPVLLFHKQAIAATTPETIARYHALGYPTYTTDIAYTDSMHALEKAFQNEQTVLYGQSGVGKSTLIRHLISKDTNIVTQALTKYGSGKHTTTGTTQYRHGGLTLFDTPGIGNTRIHLFTPDELAYGFVDITRYAKRCRFRNCAHTESTAGCAVTQAVAHGTIHATRYRSYMQCLKRVCKK